MKISLYIPDGKDERQFVKGELAQAESIKSKTTRKSVIAGLKKILSVLDYRQSGMAIFTDGA